MRGLSIDKAIFESLVVGIDFQISSVSENGVAAVQADIRTSNLVVMAKESDLVAMAKEAAKWCDGCN